MLNRVVEIGRLTSDPSLRYTTTGVAVTTFTIAVERNFKNSNGEREADFIPCVVYRQLAEIVANNLSKGKLAGIDGRLQTRTFDDKNGQRHYVTEVIAENIQFLSPKEHTEASNGGVERPYAGDMSNVGHEVHLDDDIPF